MRSNPEKKIPVPSVELSPMNERGQLYSRVVEVCQTLCRLGGALDKADSTVERTRLERQMNALSGDAPHSKLQPLHFALFSLPSDCQC